MFLFNLITALLFLTIDYFIIIQFTFSYKFTINSHKVEGEITVTKLNVHHSHFKVKIYLNKIAYSKKHGDWGK